MALTYTRRRLSSAQREALYERCRGTKDFPDCNICGLPITPGQAWDASHDPEDAPNVLRPRDAEGVAHARCNRLHGAQVVHPLVAKCDRIHRRHIGAHVSRFPLPGGRNSHVKRKIGGGVVERRPRIVARLPEADLDRTLEAVATEMSRS
ncbi:hypothetical protein ACRQ5Q_22550 [Bradyrhizobium sp. PMVTL-01]|uniref:hypothetical protein n=1 Tax=Bradyrhizobium sp. PMVTL-01 TaxID=3434999 RepID=UPI003F6EBB77